MLQIQPSGFIAKNIAPRDEEHGRLKQKA